MRVPTLRRLLLSAYDAGNRKLPWRGETDPYRIWVSEVMLQQTRVDTVIPYYGKWLERFPDLGSLAVADEDEVLRVWQGLGYYSRARRLHQGARVVRERYGGVLPDSSDGLRDLPGIGDYTAGAVASIAYGEVVPAVDGNVRRVLARLLDLPTPSPAELRGLAEELVDPERPGDFNQALMELGAMVCLPRSSRCGECPLQSECLALAQGTVGERPARKSRKAVREVDVAVLVAVARNASGEPRFLLRKRPSNGLLAGMWEFPGEEVEGARAGARTEAAVRKRARERAMELARELGLGHPGHASDQPPSPSMDLPMVTHVFSHLKARYWPIVFACEPPVSGWPVARDGRWVSKGELDRLPLPVAQRKIEESLLTGLGI